jgi:hypothetical protein
MPGQSGYAVGWGTLALINAGLAQGKQRSGLVWFALSLVLGPLATLLIVVLPVPTEGHAAMGRADWVVVAIVLLAFVLAIVGLVGFGLAAAPHVGGG